MRIELCRFSGNNLLPKSHSVLANINSPLHHVHPIHGAMVVVRAINNC